MVLAPGARSARLLELPAMGGAGAPGQPAGEDPPPPLVAAAVEVDGGRRAHVAGQVPGRPRWRWPPAPWRRCWSTSITPTVVGEVCVGGQGSGLPRLAGGVVEGVEPVGGGLVGAETAREVPAPGGRGHDALQEAAEHLGRFVEGGAGPVDGHGVVREIGQREVAQEPPAVGVRGGAEAGLALGHTGEDLRGGAAFAVEQFLRPVGAQPGFQLPQVLRVVADAGERDLVGAPGVLDGEAVDLVRDRSSPSGCAGRSSARAPVR
ncbi:hypothetical protein SCYAM73S_07695 [Streptomyces cyaneofuscatus]